MNTTQSNSNYEDRLTAIERILFRDVNSAQFDRQVISKNKIISEKNGIKVKSDTNALGFEIRTGSATTNSGITAAVGTLPKGSIYVSSNGTGEIWVMQTSTWTKLTI